MKPRIGITANYSDEMELHCLKNYYVASVVKAGGIPLLLASHQDMDSLTVYIQTCDGFILTGGGDADPSHWGELPVKELGKVTPLRDGFEIELARRLLKEHKPLLGICRGCQILNIAAGGSLLQDIHSYLNHDQKAPAQYPFHPVFIEAGSRLAQIVGSQSIRVNSFHHQAVKDPGLGLKIAACAPDGIIEAVESRDQFYVLGVQWHPEGMQDNYASVLFRSLVDAAKYNIMDIDR